MTRPAPIARAFSAALIVGLAGDALMRGGMLRVGFTLWIALLAFSVLVLTRVERDVSPTPQLGWLMAGAVAASLGLVWRDAPMLFPIDLLSVLCMSALTIWQGSGGRIATLRLTDPVRAALLAVLNSMGGAFGLMQDARTNSSANGSTRTRAIVIGVVLAIPPLLVVGALLESSDVVFKSFVDNTLGFIAANWLQHVVVIFALTWVSTGWIRAALGRALPVTIPDVPSPSLPLVSVSVALYALAALLVLFMATQLRVLFGGETYLMATQSLTVASYARQGFYQLIVASGVVLVTLIAARWLSSPNSGSVDAGTVLPYDRKLRLVATVLLLLIVSLLASASTRMWLYVREFGLSVDRVFACAFMVWVLATVITFAVLMLRGHHDRFARTTLLVTVAWVATLNLVNLEALVVRTNIARAQHGETFDAAYHAALSADALPTLIEQAPQLAPADCKALDQALVAHWTKRLADPQDGGMDWRTLNYPMWRAKQWMESRGDGLRCNLSAAPARGT